MKKSVVKIVVLLMVTISVLAMPLAAGATAYSGGYSGINYVAHTGESQSKIKADISTSSSASLYLEMIPTVCYYQGGEWHTDSKQSVTNDASGSQYLSKYNYFTNYAYNNSLPNAGYFVGCYYSFQINGHTVLNNVHESF